MLRSHTYIPIILYLMDSFFRQLSQNMKQIAKEFPRIVNFEYMILCKMVSQNEQRDGNLGPPYDGILLKSLVYLGFKAWSITKNLHT